MLIYNKDVDVVVPEKYDNNMMSREFYLMGFDDKEISKLVNLYEDNYHIFYNEIFFIDLIFRLFKENYG